MSCATFICPRCAYICVHPLEAYFRWCPVCKAVTGSPPEMPEPSPQTPWQVIRDNQDDCLHAIEDKKPLPTRALQALPPWRAVQMARLADATGAGLQDGTLEQLRAEAVRVTSAGQLGDWWPKEAS